jgi:hypothetical protein
LKRRARFYFLDGVRDLDASRARVRAVERRAATPHALDVVEDVEAFLGPVIPRIEDEPVGVDDGRRAEVRAVRPIDRAGRGAAGAQDALGGVVEPGPVGPGLDALAGGLVAVSDQVRLDRSIRLEERLHVDDQVLQDRQTFDRLDGDRGGLAVLGQQIFDQDLASKTIHAVDPHGVRAAHAVGAGAAEAEGAVDVPLDVVQQVQDAVGGESGEPRTTAVPVRR